jgi:hypothetical protein
VQKLSQVDYDDLMDTRDWSLAPINKDRLRK